MLIGECGPPDLKYNDNNNNSTSIIRRMIIIIIFDNFIIIVIIIKVKAALQYSIVYSNYSTNFISATTNIQKNVMNA